MICFLDMDGVLVDFFTGVNTIFGIPESPHKYDWFEDYGVSREQMNMVCGTDFFAGLEWMCNGKQILKVIEAKFDEIYLLTAPMPNPGASTGKELWVERHLPQYKNKLILTRVQKALFADLDRVLIDDKDSSIAEFIAAGGHGILVPRPWNELHGWSNETLQVVKNSLEVL